MSNWIKTINSKYFNLNFIKRISILENKINEENSNFQVIAIFFMEEDSFQTLKTFKHEIEAIEYIENILKEKSNND